MKNIIFKKKYIILFLMFTLFIISTMVVYFSNNNKYREVYASNEIVKEKEVKKEEKANDEIKEEIKEFYVDIKGEVTNPGVYLVNQNNIVNDVINLAGGITKNANTKCINLSMKVEEEMVIYIYSNIETRKMLNNTNTNNNNNANVCTITKNDAHTNISDANKKVEITNETTNNIENKETNNVININNATLNELMTLSGIGESKAKAIIKYREENGGFKSIDEIKNVSGIGDSVFNKIKDLISV